MREITVGAIGAWMDDAPGNYEGRLWRVREVSDDALRLEALDWNPNEEETRPGWWTERGLFWCLLDAGIVNI